MSILDTKQLLLKLTSPVGVAGEEESSFESLRGLFSQYGNVKLDDSGSIIVSKEGKGKHVLLDAHLDTIGFVVTETTEDGFLRLSKVGGIDMRITEGAEITVHGEKDIFGVICTVPPHLSDGESRVSKDGTVVADVGFTKEQCEKIVSVGDKASYRNAFYNMGENEVSATYTDDRAGICVLLKAMEYAKNCDKKITLVCSSQEETGGTGSICTAFSTDADLAVCVDVSFGYTPDCKISDCGKMNGGPMIGYSPILNREYCDLLCQIAEEKNIPYQKEIMNGRTGTNADHITISKGGIKTALVSLPQKYMHTPIETVDVRDIESSAKLIAEFIERV